MLNQFMIYLKPKHQMCYLHMHVLHQSSYCLFLTHGNWKYCLQHSLEDKLLKTASYIFGVMHFDMGVAHTLINHLYRFHVEINRVESKIAHPIQTNYYKTDGLWQYVYHQLKMLILTFCKPLNLIFIPVRNYIFNVQKMHLTYAVQQSCTWL